MVSDSGDGSRDGGGNVKRPAASDNSSSSEPAKRRAAYISRACDSCRKRKGRCDGARPCHFCSGRGRQCVYSLTTNEWRTVQDTVGHDDIIDGLPKESQWMPEAITSLGTLVMSLHKQIDSLNARIGQNNTASSPSGNAAATTPLSTTGKQADQPSPYANPVRADDQSTPRSAGGASAEDRATASKVRPLSSFHGPTSPDFSLNMAQKQANPQKTPPETGSGSADLPSINDEQSGDEDEEDDEQDCPHSNKSITRRRSSGPWDRNREQRLPEPRSTFDLHEIPQRLSLREGVRLLRVYDEVVGPFHPIVDISVLAQQLEKLYPDHDGRSPLIGSLKSSVLDKDKSLILALALCIALFAENTSPEGKIGRRIFHACQDAINSRLLATPTDLNHVVLAIMTGLCYFFDGATQSAWRVCGIAGSMLMELGLHNREVAQRVLSSDKMREDAVNVTCSIIILDRQWSAATGLPAHFQESVFEQNLQATVSNPYLKAMMGFLLISDKVSATMSTALKGQPYEDDDAFELLNFQIGQWLSNAIKTHVPSLLEKGYSVSCQAPSWAVLLSLRANSVRGMLLRPFFFAKSSTLISERILTLALKIVSDTVATLVTLDKATDIYRKQHPYYQHILAGACALLSLMISCARQNRINLSAEASAQVISSIQQNFWNAVSLASAYSQSSRISRRLQRRLEVMKQPLIGLGIINAAESSIVQQQVNSSQARQPGQRQAQQSHQGQKQPPQRQQPALQAAASAAKQQQQQQRLPLQLANQGQVMTGYSDPTYDFSLSSFTGKSPNEDALSGSPPLDMGLEGEFAWFMDANSSNAEAMMGFPGGQLPISGIEDVIAWGPF